MIRPPRLRRGDVIGIVAPAGAVDREAVERGAGWLEQAGYRIRLGASVGARLRYLSGSDAARRLDLDEMARDPAVRAVFAARGGYGSGRLLPLLDAETFRADPKCIVGHSDITFLLNYIAQRAGVASFHGPMASWLAERPAAATAALALLSGESPEPMPVPEVIRDGAAEGVLVGGCLSIVAAMLGTPYAVQTRGCLLFLEDVNERPFRIDRMLHQLQQAGALDGIAGLVFGEMPGCFEGEAVSLAELVQEVCGGVAFPIAAGLASGHGAGTVTLPLGVRARLEGDRLILLEPAVS